MGVDDVKLTVDNADGIVQDSLNQIILTDSRLQLKGALIQVVVAFQCSHSTALNQKYGLQVHLRNPSCHSQIQEKSYHRHTI